ncbi:Histidine--tRNA ligase [Candidatus Norongarragalina meridionalis]|nr:Histidine--tRNA ligase [Candidatus Norongarragalina meridionalis]
MDLTPVRGCRDFLPEKKIARDAVIEKLRRVFEAYGFNPLETPALENFEVLSSKYAGGDEILKETYKLTDQGKRDLGLRYDLTVPLCRVVASNPRMTLPFKRYQIASVWRDGPIKAGRYREFVQCDVDTIGAKGMIADAELIALTQDAFDSLGMKTFIKINNRKLLDALLLKAGVPSAKQPDAILSLDKLAKIGKEGVRAELFERGVEAKSAEEILAMFDSFAKKGNDEIIDKLASIVGAEDAGLKELRDVMQYCAAFGVREDFVAADPSLARGLSYYTGTVFEAFLTEGAITSSIAAGGRYDKLVGAFAGRGEDMPAVGISFGLDVIGEALADGTKEKKTVVRAFVIPIKTGAAAAKAAQELRRMGVPTAIDLNDRGVSRCLEYAAKEGIPYAVLVGEAELKQKSVKLRDMASGKEELLSVAEAAARIKSTFCSR